MEKRLYRSRSHRMLGGVCGGLAEYLNADPSVIRLAWIVFACLAGSGLIAYLLAWIVIPEEPAQP